MRQLIPLAGLTVAVALMLGIVSHSARSHSWYPLECCSGLDCAPAEIENIRLPTAGDALPITIVKTKFGTAVVPPNFPLRESKDGGLHACMRPQQDGTMKLLCLFVPPST